MGRKRYRSKGFGIEVYAFLVIGILLLIRNILTFVSENPIIKYTGILAVILLVMLKLYVDKQNKLKEEQRKLEKLRAGRSINYLLNKYEKKPTDFEVYVAMIFNALGYETEVTKATGDGGKDIIMNKDGFKYVVEVKLYSEGNKIGREKIQKLQGAMLDSVADRAIFVTTSKFTKESIEYGQKHEIILIDGKALVKLIDKALGEGELSYIKRETNPILMIENFLK